MFDESDNQKGISQFGENVLILCHSIFKKLKILRVSGRIIIVIVNVKDYFEKVFVKD
jgi:hypothetical protein